MDKPPEPPPDETRMVEYDAPIMAVLRLSNDDRRSLMEAGADEFEDLLVMTPDQRADILPTVASRMRVEAMVTYIGSGGRMSRNTTLVSILQHNRRLEEDALSQSAAARCDSYLGLPSQIITVAAAPDYQLEDVLTNKTSIDLSEKNRVVNGWRRENGATTQPRLFLRSHLIEKKKEVDKFFNSKKTRLYVSGPPGSGKTSFFLLYCAQRTLNPNQRALLVQYRDWSACEIMILETGNIKRVSLTQGESLDRENLLKVLRNVLRKENRFDFFVFDGVRQKIDACANVLAVLNSTFTSTGQKGISITSLQFSIKDGDGTAKTDQYMSVLSWVFTDYVDAFYSDLLTIDDWRSILEDEKDNEEMDEDDEEMDKSDEDNKEMPEYENETSSDDDAEELIALLERKFYYAGGSVRFMLHFTLEELVSTTLPSLLNKMTTQLWDDFCGLNIHASSETTVNSLMQMLERGNDPRTRGNNLITLPVSKYVLHHAYDICRTKLVKAVKAAAMSTKNPALQGWAFELDQIEWINDAVDKRHICVANASGDVVLSINTEQVFFDGIELSGDTSADGFVIKCTKWNQGCFDIAFFHDSKLITIQFTMSSNHSVKLRFVRYLKEALEELGKNVNETVHHIAIVGDDLIAANFQFKDPETSSGTKAFNVVLAKSSKLNRSIPAIDGGSREMKMGRLLETVSCPTRRASKRLRKENSSSTQGRPSSGHP